MKRDWKKLTIQLLTGTAMGLVLGGIAGLLVGYSYFFVKKYQMDNHHPTNLTLPQFLQELLGTFVNVMLLFILPAVCFFYGAIGGAVTGLLTMLVNRGKMIGAMIGAVIGAILFLVEWHQPSELLPYAATAIPLEALVGWLIAWFFARKENLPVTT